MAQPPLISVRRIASRVRRLEHDIHRVARQLELEHSLRGRHLESSASIPVGVEWYRRPQAGVLDRQPDSRLVEPPTAWLRCSQPACREIVCLPSSLLNVASRSTHPVGRARVPTCTSTLPAPRKRLAVQRNHEHRRILVLRIDRHAARLHNPAFLEKTARSRRARRVDRAHAPPVVQANLPGVAPNDFRLRGR